MALAGGVALSEWDALDDRRGSCGRGGSGWGGGGFVADAEFGGRKVANEVFEFVQFGERFSRKAPMPSWATGCVAF